MERKIPIGVQSFERLRNDRYLYVDKTEYIYNLADQGRQYFLSRPRRFGKSLLLSTMRAYFEGKRELFDGLKIEELSQDDPDPWQAYPVFYFDFNRENYNREAALEEVLEAHLKEWETLYGTTDEKVSLAIRFQQLLVRASEKTGCGCVVLVDEYDKPLLDVLENTVLEEHNKEVFRGFFSALKSFDQYIRFVFITGVTKFSKVSIFSDLNQLNDISMHEDYAAICGITQSELEDLFEPEMAILSKQNSMTEEETLQLLKRRYDGYHFHYRGSGIYNPFSLLKAFFEKDFGSYWFETGTPTFLVRRLKQLRFDARRFTNGSLYASESGLSDYRADSPDLVPLLYQTGYLTIADYDLRRRRYTLSFPNEEVQYGFLTSLASEYLPDSNPSDGTDIFALDEYIENGDAVCSAICGRSQETV